MLWRPEVITDEIVAVGIEHASLIPTHAVYPKERIMRYRFRFSPLAPAHASCPPSLVHRMKYTAPGGRSSQDCTHVPAYFDNRRGCELSS
jgi:hypothetical protein